MSSRLKDAFRFLKQKFVRIDKNKIVFTSFNGHYSDSPKYISEKIHELAPKISQVWLVSPKYMSLLPDYVSGVEIGTKEAELALSSARAHVDNVYGVRSYMRRSNGFFARLIHSFYACLVKKRGQYLFTTWHGTPLKRMSRDVAGNTDCAFSCPNATMLMGNLYTLEIMKRLSFGKIKMELTGTPRNDLMFISDEKKHEIKCKLGLPEDNKIVIYAPTFRTDGADIENKNVLRSGVEQMNSMDIPKLLEALSERFGGNFSLVCRFHYHVEAMIDFDALEKAHPGMIINGNKHDDMAEYLAVSDVLITDASSSMFDFSLSKKPCFLLFPDVEYYANEERGFYMDLDSLPYPWSRDVDGMMENIKNFDGEKYIQGVEKLLEKMGNADNGKASEKCAEYIISRCFEK